MSSGNSRHRRCKVIEVTFRSGAFSRKMSYFLPHLPSGWHVDQAILSEEDRVVVIRFGHDYDNQCMKMDETLNSVAEKVQNFAVIYLVDITEVPDFNKVRFASYLNVSLPTERATTGSTPLIVWTLAAFM